MGYGDFIATLDPKTAKRIKTAMETEVIKLPLASYGLTKALNGGIARGRIALTFGNTSSGKSLLAMQSIGLWQKQGLVCAYVDAEGTYDKEFAARLGINNEELILIQARSSARVEAEIRPLLQSNIDVIVIDSISDILPEAFIGKDGSLNDQEDRKQLGAHAKAITNMVNGIHYLNQDTAVWLLSQTTTEISQTYVKQIPHGGKKTLFASSQVIKLTSSNTENQQIKGHTYVGDLVFESPIGRKVDAIVEKNKLGPQHRKCSYDLYYDGSYIGIDTIGEVVDEAMKYLIVEKAGAWFKYDGNSYQGRDKMVEFFKESEEELERLKKQIHLVETGELVD